MRTTLSILLAFLLTASCIKQNKQEKEGFTHNNLYSTLWMQTAAEYTANSMQVYQAAATQLDKLILDKEHTALPDQNEGYQDLPPAIILDVDETVLDNSPYQGMLAKENKTFAADSWNHWISLKQAGAIPGVVEFLNMAQQKGITIFYVTNRRCTELPGELCPQDRQTFENLQNIGIENVTIDNVMLRDEQPDWGRDKTSRRAFAAKNYRVIMLFGDNLGDFLEDNVETIQERMSLIEENKSRWGHSWYMLANPSYGGWQSVLKKPLEDNLITY